MNYQEMFFNTFYHYRRSGGAGKHYHGGSEENYHIYADGLRQRICGDSVNRPYGCGLSGVLAD